MRKLAASIVFAMMLAAPLAGEPMKEGERQRVLAHLEMTSESVEAAGRSKPQSADSRVEEVLALSAAS